MKYSKTVSVIVPVFNCDKYLKRCIESIINQTFLDFELILINDGSTDNSEAICKKYAKLDERIILINQSNSGVAVTRNKGISISKGKYLCFVDADDYVEPDFIDYFVSNVRDDIDYIFFPTKFKVMKQNLNNKDVMKLILSNENYGGYIWNKFYKSKIIKKNKIKFDESIRICEDLVFNFEYLKFSNKCLLLPLPKYHYTLNPNSALHSKLKKSWFTVLDAYDKIVIIAKEYSDVYEFAVAHSVLNSINVKTKMALNKYEDNLILKRCNVNINSNINKSLKSKKITLKFKIRLGIYYYFYNIVLILKILLNKK